MSTSVRQSQLSTTGCGPQTRAGTDPLEMSTARRPPSAADYSASDPQEIARHFPVLNCQIADRLVVLLVPERSAKVMRSPDRAA